jgi:SAM-dependent methyltransferase
MLYFYIVRNRLLDRPVRVLEVAPKPCFMDFCRRKPHVSYLGIDIESHLADVLTDVGRAGLRSGMFDLVVCFHVLEHIRDDSSAMREIRRVLTAGGLAIIQVPLRGDITFEDPGADPSEYERLFGQDDHVRWYGLDIVERLADAGLAATLEPILETLPQETVQRAALQGDDRLLLVARPAMVKS